jgi:hypothetical protein
MCTAAHVVYKYPYGILTTFASTVIRNRKFCRKFTKIVLLVVFLTEHRGRVINSHASYSGGPGFVPRPEDRLS